MAALENMGSDDAVNNRQIRHWNRYQGEFVEKIYEGPAEAVLTLYDNYKGGFNSVDEARLETSGGVGVLSVTQGGAGTIIDITEDGEDIYELLSVEQSKAIESHPYWTNNGLSVDDIAIVFAFYHQFEKLPDGTPRPSLLSDVATGNTATAEYLLDVLNAGVHEYFWNSYILRATTVTSHRSNVNKSLAGVNRVEDPPNVSAVNRLISGLPPQGQWLKRAPNIRASGKAKWNIVQEWWHAEDGWLSGIYEGGNYTP